MTTHLSLNVLHGEQGKAVEKANLNGAVGVANSGKSGIIGEKNKKPITAITDSAISKVPNINIDEYTERQCLEIQKNHKELLEYSRTYNDNKEVAFVFDNTMSSRKEFKGSDDSLNFGGELYGKDLIVMHNHPRNSSYSDTDIAFLLTNANVKTFSIAKNNGGVEILTKTKLYDAQFLLNDFKRQYKKYVKTGSDSEKDKAVSTLLKRNGDMIIWNKKP